jgi:hypothetical protein
MNAMMLARQIARANTVRLIELTFMMTPLGDRQVTVYPI